LLLRLSALDLLVFVRGGLSKLEAADLLLERLKVFLKFARLHRLAEQVL